MTPVPIGQYLGGSDAYTFATTVNAPAGGTIVLMFGGAGPPGPGNVITDSAGNTYVTGPVDATTGWYSYALAPNNLHLPSGGTIHEPSLGGATHQWCQAFWVDAILSIDVVGVGNAVGTPVTTPPLSTFPEFAVGMSHVYPGGGGSITPPVGWTTALHGTVTDTGSLLAEVDYLVTSSAAAITYGPAMFGFHAPTYLNVFVFKPAVTPPPPSGAHSEVKWF